MDFSKTQLFGVRNNRSIITWGTTWLFLFTLSILSDQPSSVVSTRLIVFYNFKGFKPNKSASPFKQKIRRFWTILGAFVRRSLFQPVQWLDCLLAALFLKILFLVAKTSSLALSTLKAITPSLCYIFPLALLLLLRRLFLLHLP